MTVDELVNKTVGRSLAPLAEQQRRSRKELEELQFEIRERLINGLYEIFSDGHIVSSDEAVEEAYEQSIGPDIESGFDHFRVEDYDRDSVPGICDRCIDTMAEELNRIVDHYKRQDARLHAEQFIQVY